MARFLTPLNIWRVIQAAYASWSEADRMQLEISSFILEKQGTAGLIIASGCWIQSLRPFVERFWSTFQADNLDELVQIKSAPKCHHSYSRGETPHWVVLVRHSIPKSIEVGSLIASFWEVEARASEEFVQNMQRCSEHVQDMYRTDVALQRTCTEQLRFHSEQTHDANVCSCHPTCIFQYLYIVSTDCWPCRIGCPPDSKPCMELLWDSCSFLCKKVHYFIIRHLKLKTQVFKIGM